VAAAGGTRLYLLTQRLHFPLYLAGNTYYSPDLGSTWQRVSPNTPDWPVVSRPTCLGTDGLVVLREGMATARA